MSEEQVSDRIVTIPNLISFIRLAAVPFFWWLVLGADRIGVATLLLILVSWTDWIDGYLARRLDQVTKLGKMLDPVADRLMIASAVVVGLFAGIVPVPIAVPLIAREVYMATLTLVVAGKGAKPLEVRQLGKNATFIVYGSIHSFYLVAVPFLDALFLPVAWTTSTLGLLMYWLVAVRYTGDARRAISELESSSAPQESL